MSARALIPVADLRRMAKVARDERVIIEGRLAIDGSMLVHVRPASRTIDEDPSDLDRRLDAFGAS